MERHVGNENEIGNKLGLNFKPLAAAGLHQICMCLVW